MPNPLQTLMDALDAGDDARAEQAAAALTAVGDEALPALRRILEDRDPHRRWWAPRALTVVGTDRAIELILTALEDPDPDVRACAAVALSKLKPPEAIQPLVAHLSDPSAYVSRLAADALSQFGRPAVEALIQALKEGDTATRAGAARALSTIQPYEAISVLYEALDDRSAVVTNYAEEALEKMGVGILLFRP
ncbi:MAG: HEAT repeat domain-containing protein [Anaerolineae bacterium]